IWMENGRFITGRSAVLVVRVRDVKERPECRYLICDGGRTNHALVSDWEPHPLFVIPERNGRPVLTTVAGPTCMALDRTIRMTVFYVALVFTSIGRAATEVIAAAFLPTTIAICLAVSYVVGRHKLLPDSFVDETGRENSYRAEFCKALVLREACELTRDSYGG